MLLSTKIVISSRSTDLSAAAVSIIGKPNPYITQAPHLRIVTPRTEPATRKSIEDLCASLGPLVGLGTSDPETGRSVLRKIGVNHIVVTPEGKDGRSRDRATSEGSCISGVSRSP